MKVETNNVRNALLLLMLGTATLVAQPETAELREPEAIEVVKPVVPAEFARFDIEGRVDVTFRIDEKGRTRDIEVVASSHTEYAESVKNALRKWRFEQPEVEGVLYHLPVVFN